MSENLPEPSKNTSEPMEPSDNEASPSPGSDNTDTRVEGVPVGGVALLAALRAWNRRRKRRRLETSAAAVLETAHAQLRAVTGPAIGATDAEQILGPRSDAPPRPTQFTPNPGSSDSEAADAPDGPVHKSQARAITTSPETDVTATPEPSTNDKKTKPPVARAKAPPTATAAPPETSKEHSSWIACILYCSIICKYPVLMLSKAEISDYLIMDRCHMINRDRVSRSIGAEYTK